MWRLEEFSRETRSVDHFLYIDCVNLCVKRDHKTHEVRALLQLPAAGLRITAAGQIR